VSCGFPRIQQRNTLHCGVDRSIHLYPSKWIDLQANVIVTELSSRTDGRTHDLPAVAALNWVSHFLKTLVNIYQISLVFKKHLFLFFVGSLVPFLLAVVEPVICFVDNFLHFVKNSLKNNFSKPVEL
jgi:hypothetical protein